MIVINTLHQAMEGEQRHTYENVNCGTAKEECIMSCVKSEVGNQKSRT